MRNVLEFLIFKFRRKICATVAMRALDAPALETCVLPERKIDGSKVRKTV
jgi:hypothetical protein